MYVIRKAQEHHRNVELHLYRKVGLLVRPSILEVSWNQSPRGIKWSPVPLPCSTVSFIVSYIVT